MIYQIGFQRKLQTTEQGAIKQTETFFLESGYHPSFDTVRHLVSTLYDGDIAVGSVKIKSCPKINAIRLRKQTTVYQLN